MANSYPTGFQSDNLDTETPTAQDRGLFDCFGKKDEKEDVPDVPMTDAQHKPSLAEKLHRSNSHSSSSSEEEVEEDGVKIRRRKKKGLTDRIKEKLPGHKNAEGADVSAEGAHCHHPAAAANADGLHPEEKKGFLEKIKEKLPGHHKDEPAAAPHVAPAPTPVFAEAPTPAYTAEPVPAYAAAPVHPHNGADGHNGGVQTVHHDPQEKKGIFDKIKEKLPGGHKDGNEAKKEY